jgi:glycosyltransferase involved in cell wall biosynthesis
MKVTVVVRTCNRPEFLKEALASVQLQTHQDWEVLIFDDSASDENVAIYKWFKNNNPNKRIMYITTMQSYDMFGNSWLLAPDLAYGEIMVRLDDDDILASDCLTFLSEVYTLNSELDFSYGSSVFFSENTLTNFVETKNPFEHEKSKAQWAAYTIPNNHPWDTPWAFIQDYYSEPTPFTSIIHAAKANALCVYHTYTMRTSSVKKVKDKISITSNFVDDLEFLGSLDYLGLGHNSIKKVLAYVRTHNLGRVSDYNKTVNGTNMYQENFRVRDKVDHLRTSGFLSKIIPINHKDNFNNGIDAYVTNNFKNITSNIENILSKNSYIKLGNVSIQKIQPHN